MVEIRRHLSGEMVVEFLPPHPPPARRETKFGQSIDDFDSESMRVGDLLRSLDGTGERRCADRSNRRMSQEVGCLADLSFAVAAQPVLLEIGVDDMVGVGDFAMPDEVDCAGHDR